ncbi:MAG TPA: RND transporter [bacterium]|nr:RND transporter [bacterium]
MNISFQKIIYPLLASLTLGLAPFFPEPHIWKQIVNIANGTFTEPLDWFDLAMHGAPWIWLIYALVKQSKKPVEPS